MNLANIEYQDKLRQYVLQMRPVFKPNALFSDETANYVTPMEPDPGDIVTIRFRTWKDNVDKVYLVSNDRHLAMEYEKSEGDFDYFKIRLVMQEESVHYFFEIHAGKIRCFYNKIGVSRDRLDVYDFTIAPGFHTPEWAKGAVMYQIFVDRFSSGDTNNTVEDCEYYYIGDYSRKVTDWRKNPSFMGVREFYGGDLQGVMNKLDYLQDLGVDVIYFNPIFVSPSNHKYDIQDYDYIDPHYGKIVSDGGETLKDGDTINAHASKYIKRVTDKANLESSNTFFVQLVEEIHRRGMKVILDGVFNHTGFVSRYFNGDGFYPQPGAAQSRQSPYYPWFHFQHWPDRFDSWWGIYTLPAVNEGEDSYRDYIIRGEHSIVRRWLQAGADGWRLDVADELPDDFIRELHQAVRAADPNAVVIGEVWEDGSTKIAYGVRRRHILGGHCDGLMNYPFRTALLNWLAGGDAAVFRDSMETIRENYPPFAFYGAMNFLGTHDTARILTLLGAEGTPKTKAERAAYRLSPAELARGLAKLRLAGMLLYSFPGSPTLFYGDEAGVQGFEDPLNRGAFPWGSEDAALTDFFRTLGQLRRTRESLRSGALRYLLARGGALAIERERGGERTVTALNAGDAPADLTLAWDAPTAQDAVTGQRFLVIDGKAHLTLPPLNGVILI